MSFIARQPNGLLCRFSTITDCITDYNMTDEEYIEMCAERGREEARNVLNRYMQPYELVKEQFVPSNMTRKEFKAICKEMESKKKVSNND